MDTETKLCFAKLLAEIYDLKNEISTLKKEQQLISPYRIAALNAGIEPIINNEFEKTDFSLTEKEFTTILEYFNTLTTEQIDALTGFYKLPNPPYPVNHDFPRHKWVCALRLMKAQHQFNEILIKIEGSQDSPSEMGNLD